MPQHTLNFSAELQRGQLLSVTVDIELLDQRIEMKRAQVHEMIPALLPSATARPRCERVGDEIKLRKQEWADETLRYLPGDRPLVRQP